MYFYFSGSPIKIRLGDLDLRIDEDDGSEYKDFEIENIIVHPNYKPISNENDIALIKLTLEVEFTRFIRPACVWNKPHIEHQLALATGWGATEYGTF